MAQRKCSPTLLLPRLLSLDAAVTTTCKGNAPTSKKGRDLPKTASAAPFHWAFIPRGACCETCGLCRDVIRVR